MHSSGISPVRPIEVCFRDDAVVQIKVVFMVDVDDIVQALPVKEVLGRLTTVYTTKTDRRVAGKAVVLGRSGSVAASSICWAELSRAVRSGCRNCMFPDVWCTPRDTQIYTNIKTTTMDHKSFSTQSNRHLLIGTLHVEFHIFLVLRVFLLHSQSTRILQCDTNENEWT